jgi:two-component system, cell cycle response regulator
MAGNPQNNESAIEAREPPSRGGSMDDETKILISAPKPATPATGRNACLVHIYPAGPNLGARYPLKETPLIVGRDEGCQICVNDDSVSRRHARLEPLGEGYGVVDLQSTNGTYVNDHRVTLHQLKDGDYLRIGNGIFRFLAGGNVEAEYHEEIYRLTIIDALTEIHNKRYFQDFLARSLSCAIRYRRPLSLIMFDIDKFKAINDQLGHLGGDYTLRELASVIKRAIRREDLFARYGGEEFALVMPETAREDGITVAEHLRRTVEQHPFQYLNHRYRVTISLGVSAVTGENWLTTSELTQQSDENLYEAKRQGRNRVVS